MTKRPTTALAGTTSEIVDQASRSIAVTATATIWIFLFGDAAILGIASGHALIGSPSGTIAALFSLDFEPTIPAWYASTKLLIVAALLGALAATIPGRSVQKWLLAAAALLFLVMSCDESAAMHERIQHGIGSHVLSGRTDHIYDSMVLGKVVLGLAALTVAAGFVIAIVGTLRRIGAGSFAFALGFVLLAVGAVGVDLAQEFFPSSGTGAILAMALEEGLEMVGVTFMIYGAMQATALKSVVLQLKR